MKKQAIAGLPYVAVAVLALGIATAVLELWTADWTVPFHYSGDGTAVLMCLKGIQENGWYLHNEALGAPGGMDLHDYPMCDNLHLFVMKLIVWVTGSPVVAFNAYYIATFPLAALGALLVFRRFGVSLAPALAGSLLFAFLPYHVLRGQEHLYLAAYFLVPPMVLVILWVYQGAGPILAKSPEGRYHVLWHAGPAVASIAICLLVSSAGIYYAFFGCILLLVAGLTAAQGPRLLAFGNSLLLVGVLFAGTLANLSPSLWYWHEHGKNDKVGHRLARDTELFGLKIAQLLLPVTEHRLPGLAQIKNFHNKQTILCNENDSCTLGFLGAAGFLALLARLLLRRRKNDPAPTDRAVLLDGLAVMSAGALLFATLGGFGMLYSLLINPSLRGQNRIVVYIGFCALFGVVLSLDRIQSRFKSVAGRTAFLVGLVLLVVLGVLDQTPSTCVPKYETARQEYRRDGEYYARIEEVMPAKAMIFQMPWHAFPEEGCVLHMQDYQHLRAYLHTHGLRWSFGVVHGREAPYVKECGNAPNLEAFLHSLRRTGFAGIHLDRRGYADRAEMLERGLAYFLGNPLAVSENGDMVFYTLTPGTERENAPEQLAHP